VSEGVYAPRPVGKPLWKPAKQEAKAVLQAGRAKRKAVAAKDERAAKLAHREHMRKLRLDVWVRDQGCCRVCEAPVALESEVVSKRMQLHHHPYRSAGGKDIPAHTMTLCWACHKAEHAHEIRITGDPQTTLIIKSISLETGQVKSIWESTV
jgi:DNA repair exonuclease SbcCD ATPase subunit